MMQHPAGTRDAYELFLDATKSRYPDTKDYEQGKMKALYKVSMGHLSKFAFGFHFGAAGSTPS